MSRRRVFLYVQHLLGIGHFRRAAILARALSERGMHVTFASGGLPLSEPMPSAVRVVQLPAARAADLTFRSLVDVRGAPVDDAWRDARREALLKAWRECKAHALILELFPFGRRQMRFELLPLLDEASVSRPRPVIVSSVRDVLAQASGEKQQRMLGVFDRYFDHVLVHGDPRLIPFERTFTFADRLGRRMHYTGFLLERSTPPDSPAGSGEIVVSAGGGAVGAGLLQTAVRARPSTQAAGRRWRLLAGVQLPNAQFEELVEQAAAARDVVVERSRADFRTLLQNCSVSVSQAGYNTLMEILDCRARAVVVPFAGGRETEQAMRARILAASGRVELVEEDALSPHTLAAAIDRAMNVPKPPPSHIDLDGARKSAELVAAWTEGLSW